MSFFTDLLSKVRLTRAAKIGIAAGAALILLIAAVIYFLPKTHEVARENSDEVAEIPVLFTNVFEDGTHTVSGVATLRNRCQPFDASGVLDSEVSPNVVRIELLAGDDEGVCLQIPEERSFEVSVEGPADSTVQVFVNGIPTSGSAI